MSVIYHNYEPIELPAGSLCEFLSKFEPIDNITSLDFEASGKHPDGMWATDAAKCEPKARVSAASLAFRVWTTDTCQPCYGNAVGVPVGGEHHDHCQGDDGRVEYRRKITLALPFDQGKIGGKPGRYIKGKGFETLPHTEQCDRRNTISDENSSSFECVCALWNLNVDDWRALIEWLRDKRIDFFNFKYDAWIMLKGLRLHKNTGYDLSPNLNKDVMLWEAISEPVEVNSLDAVSRRVLGRGKDDNMAAGLKANGVGLGKRYDLVDWDIAGPYAALDADLTLDMGDYERGRVEEGSYRTNDLTIIEREHRKAKLLFKMEQRGVAGDWDAMRVEAAKMHTEIDKLEADLPFQPPNNNTAAKYFFGPKSGGGLGLIPIKMTSGGESGQPKPSADAEVIARLASDGNEVAKAWAHIANMKSACAKWYDAWPNRAGDDGRIRTNFRQVKMTSDRKDQRSGGAISGRLSADRVQLQGVPQDWRIPDGIKGVKKLIRAKPGHQLWEIDASNAEVRVAAAVAKCKKLADLINTGANIHDLNTVTIFGQQLKASFPGGWTLQDDDVHVVIEVLATHPDWTQYRVSAKRGIFGRMYTAGIVTLKTQIDADLKRDIPRKQIQAFMDALDVAYPELKWCSRQLEKEANVATGGRGWVELVSGRRRVFGWGEKTYKAFNAVIQGGVSEMMSELMIVVEQLWPGVLLSQVHDSLWVEVPDDMSTTIVVGIQSLGKRLFEEAFSTEEIPVMFEFDAKRLA